MDTNTVIEGTVKFRDGKKWKSRWCVVRKLSPVADCIHLQLYRDSKERYKQGQTKASLSLENFLGIQSGFTLDKESNTLAIICQEVIVVLAFDTREHLMQWQVKISTNLGEGDQFLVQISSAPSRAKLSPGPARLLIQEFQFCLTVGVPPRLIAFWQIRQLRRFGVVEGKFCFEGGSRCGRGEGLYVLVTEKPEELTRAFHLAADGKLCSRKRSITRNLSVMDKARKHHTLRPESRLSDVSSLDSTIIDSPGCDNMKNPCCSCSHSREDLLSWSQHPSADFGDSVSSNDGHRFDLKSLWNSEFTMGRCTSCMSKIGNMSRSSTLTNTPCSRFPAWTMDRPKSCGSQKMSPSVTCSSVSLSSHSSRGSSCGNVEHHHRHSPSEKCNSVCSGNENMCLPTSGDLSRTPPSRPPKPAHLSFYRLQSTPTAESPTTPSVFLSPSPSCCCCHGMSPFPSPYGNYDIPKPLNLTQRKLLFDAIESPLKLRAHPQPSPDEFYDTPRKLKDSLIWEYGNYDVPPPAQPIVSTASQNQHEVGIRKSPDGTGCTNYSERESLSLNLTSHNTEDAPFPINKVKLTGEGRMPVMSPCGKIIEKPEPTYEEQLENLLENENLTTDANLANSNYANIEENKNTTQEDSTLSTKSLTDTPSEDIKQNYSNIVLVQSVQNYENFKYFFSEESKNINTDISQNSSLDNTVENNEENRNFKKTNDSTSVFCSNCGSVCSTMDINLKSLPDEAQKNCNCQLEAKNENSTITYQYVRPRENKGSTDSVISNTFLDNKCNSTSCLHEIKLDHFCTQQNGSDKGNIETKYLSKCSVSAANSPALKRITRQCPVEQTISSRLQRLRLRKRSNSADSTRLHRDDESINDTMSSDSHGKSYVLSNPSSTDSLCVVQKLEESNDNDESKMADVNKHEFKIAPLVIAENVDLQETLLSGQKHSTKYSDLVGAKRSSSVPNKFFSNRDSSSSNDSGVSTGSLSLRHFGTDFLEFEMPLTTSMSSKRHHLAMINSTLSSSSENKQKVLAKRSKSVDPLRDLTFTFESGEQQTGKSTSAEAEVPIFLTENRNKDYLSPHRTAVLPDSRSTSSGTSDMSDYIETLSFSSFSSLETPENLRYGRGSAPTMKPRSGKEYHKIDRYLLDQETKQ